MENREMMPSAPGNYLSRAYSTKDEGEIKNLAEEAEAVGNYRQAVIINEEVLHCDFGATKELRQKWARQEEDLGHFKQSAGIIFPVFGGKETAPIAERALASENFEDAHYIYYHYAYDFDKAKDTLAKWGEQQMSNGDFFNGADKILSSGAPEEKIKEIAEKSALAHNYRDAVNIYEEILFDRHEKWKEYRRAWAEEVAKTGDYVNAADILIPTKDKAGVKAFSETAKAEGKIHDALVILEDILHEYGSETSALRREWELIEPRRTTIW